MSQRTKFESQVDTPELPPNPEIPRVPQDMLEKVRDPAARDVIRWLEDRWVEYFKQSRIRQR